VAEDDGVARHEGRARRPQTGQDAGGVARAARGDLLQRVVLEVGQPADFFTVDLNDPSIAGANAESLLNHIVFSLERTAIRDVVVDGAQVITDGRHALQDEIIAEFTAAQRDLWNY